MIRQNRKIQFIILLTLVCLVGTMTIAYAVLSTTLNINGTAEVMDASWNVHFENINVNPNSVPISPKITDSDKITFTADLTTPGQFYKFTVDIVNSGSIDAMIETIITNPELTTEQKKYLRYEVEYIDGTSINETQLLKANETKTISVLVSYRNDIPTTDLPTTETNLDLEIRLVYVQATTIGTEIEGQEKIVKLVSGDLNTIGSEVCIKEECFYIINNDGYNLTMLSKYNLLIGYKYDSDTGITPVNNPTGIQDISTVRTDASINGVISFSQTNYWQNSINNDYPYIYNENSYLYEYVENYKSYLTNLKVKIEECRLLTYEELVELGCVFSTKTCPEKYSWIYNTSYWLGSVYNKTLVWSIIYTNIFDVYYYEHLDYFGVRPVIEIPITEL